MNGDDESHVKVTTDTSSYKGRMLQCSYFADFFRDFVWTCLSSKPCCYSWKHVSVNKTLKLGQCKIYFSQAVGTEHVTCPLCTLGSSPLREVISDPK